MPWVRIDDGFWCHPKVMAAGLEATGLYVRALSWSGQQLTDGKIPKHMLAALGGGARTKKAAARLVEVGLWSEGPEAYQVPDFLEFNKSRAEVTLKRDQAKGRMTRVRAGSSHEQAANKQRTGREPDAAFASGSPNPIPTHPDLTHPNTPPQTPESGAGGAAEFPLTLEAFRLAAPRGIGFPPSVFWESALGTLVKEYGDKYVAGHLGQFFSAGGRSPEVLERRCAEDWGGQPVPEKSGGTPPPGRCVHWQDTETSKGGLAVVQSCMLVTGHSGKCDWSEPHLYGETPQPREQAHG